MTDIETAVEQMLQKYLADAEQTLKAKVRQRGIVANRQLLESIKGQIVSRAGGTIIGQLSFKTHGRFQDMARIKWTKMPPVDKLAKWVENKGIQNFAFVPGSRPERLSAPEASRRIAWAIAKAKMRTGSRPRGRWYNKTFFKLIAPLAGDLLDKVGDQILEEIMAATTAARKP